MNEKPNTGSRLPTNPENDYLLNDAECPIPILGPRVTVGFWAATSEEELEQGCACEGEPLFTIIYPVGLGEGCYGWKHIDSDDEDEPLHPNSVSDTKWVDGRLEVLQYTVMCDGDRSDTQNPDGSPKEMSWAVGQDMPKYLFSRIIGVDEIPVDHLREGAIITARAVDGHYLGVDRSSPEYKLQCRERRPSEACELRARFPGYVWSPAEGGSGDRGDFALEACNSRYLRLHRDSQGRISLRASAQSFEQAALFSVVFEDQGVATLRITGEGLTLAHPCPGNEVELRTDNDPVFSRFNIAYRRG